MIELLSILLSPFLKISSEETSDEQLGSLLSDYDEAMLLNIPENATFEGDHRYDDRLFDYSDEGVLKIYSLLISYLELLKQINYGRLSDENKLNYDLFKQTLELEIEKEKFKSHLMPIGQQLGLHIFFPQLVNVQQLKTAEDFEKYFKRLRGFYKQVNDTIANMKKGIETGLVMPAFIMEQTLPQIRGIIKENPEDSVFYLGFKNRNNLSDEEKTAISNELKDLIKNNINYDYQKLYDFIKTEYLPKCRKEAGIWELHDGKERYKLAVKEFTSLNLEAEEIHKIGLNEVDRLRKLMEITKDQTGFNGSLNEFNHYIRTSPEFYYNDKNDLINGFREILKRMNQKLPELFGTLPEVKYDLKEMEEYRAVSAPAAYYYRAPLDGSRPGYFYVNTYNLPARPKYTMTALALHEAVPGHHLQIALAQELKDMPKFRRDLGQTAFIEGWALYAESLGYETGMYDDPYQRYGALTMEVWRACRLVVDTGLHHMKWTREQAFEFMKENSPNSEAEIRSEIDRYCARPGQALAYKIGELKIKQLRKKAESKLGSRFNIKHFHDNLLKHGAVPLGLLEEMVDRWIETELI